MVVFLSKRDAKESRMMRFVKLIREHSFAVFLLGYHFLFTFLYYDYFRKNGGDASFYWFLTDASRTKTFSELHFYGSDFVLRLNYFFAKVLALDIRWGFVLYSFIGYLGVWQLYRLGKLMFLQHLTFLKIPLFPLFLLLPNLHFWTSGLGKESLCFLALATFFYEVAQKNFKSFLVLLSFAVLALIRPHIALFLLVAVFSVLLLGKTVAIKHKLILGFFTVLLFSICFYMVLQLSEIHYLDWERIQKFNTYSLLSFKHSGSYVPMVDYSYPFKWFTFWFRPLPFEMPGLYASILAFENTIWLVLHLLALLVFIVKWKAIEVPKVFKIILLFALFSALIIVERYSGFGIFARTKMMMQPFVGLFLLWLLTFVSDTFQSEPNS